MPRGIIQRSRIYVLCGMNAVDLIRKFIFTNDAIERSDFLCCTSRAAQDRAPSICFLRKTPTLPSRISSAPPRFQLSSSRPSHFAVNYSIWKELQSIAMKSIPIILLGCGGVGRMLLHHIITCRSLHSKQGIVIRVVGVSDSRSLLLADDVMITGMEDEFLTKICHAKSVGSPLKSLHNHGHCQVFTDKEVLENIIAIANSLGRTTGLAVVDCSASSETIDILKQVSSIGSCVVLANKKPLTCAIEDFEKLVCHFRRIRFESTVGAGLPVIASVTRVISSGDPISRIVGSLSGTLGYVMSELEEGKTFSEIVRAAKSLGYTEPDPRDDLSGMDVARKGLILARLLGCRMNMTDIKIESLYPSEFGPDAMSTEDFLAKGLSQLDEKLKERVAAASSKGNVLRYVCVIEDLRCNVGIQELPKDSALGRLKGSDNVVEIYSRCYENSPLVIQGAGAGNDTTAAGVLADIIDLQDLFG